MERKETACFYIPEALRKAIDKLARKNNRTLSREITVRLMKDKEIKQEMNKSK